MELVYVDRGLLYWYMLQYATPLAVFWVCHEIMEEAFVTVVGHSRQCSATFQTVVGHLWFCPNVWLLKKELVRIYEIQSLLVLSVSMV